ncbi:MmcQ/YjbR family DNA-binding protein [Nocardioides sp. GY 10127]|uniref:MmcQ/YjbR family DNA-binding protein n=1 Tax=Nocardioides sp. GY 10127 TaxID=2569762 RepID=UPI0010A85CAD|nr:MmcQ/YjbR family DNA-binding protein [Nocardioides sp. GY 10127]TIC85447.1 MmcQ/YjbR family DNA-binding protein [Nocardioides sp. GY 10127]
MSIAGAGARAAVPADVDAICAELPEATLGESWGGVPTWLVRGKGFVLYREPRHDCTDPLTGEQWDDVLVLSTATLEDAASLVEDPGTPFFTIEHFTRARSKHVLLRLARVGELSRDELAEHLTDAWLARAPKTLARGWRQGIDPSGGGRA